MGTTSYLRGRDCGESQRVVGQMPEDASGGAIDSRLRVLGLASDVASAGPDYFSVDGPSDVSGGLFDTGRINLSDLSQRAGGWTGNVGVSPFVSYDVYTSLVKMCGYLSCLSHESIILPYKRFTIKG